MGLESTLITIEISLTNGVGIYLVGLPDSAVKESLMRITASLLSYGLDIPGRRTIINLAPANIRKEGSAFDLAIAIGLLQVSGQINAEDLEDFLIIGELSLDGYLRGVPGVLPIVFQANKLGFSACIIPADSAPEIPHIEGVSIYPVERLIDVINVLKGEKFSKSYKLDRSEYKEREIKRGVFKEDFKNIKGLHYAKRALEIAAAGGHNIILTGKPGSGKSMMARALPSILPQMNRDEAIETSMIYSVAGIRGQNEGLLTTPPFRSPHHTASAASLIGGGNNAMPGEISLAHNGVLYLDEIGEYPKHILDLLRQPIEDRQITITRARYRVTYPASFTLVASMNPCPCGYHGDDDKRCICTDIAIERYRSKLSGPMMDRIDIQIEVKPLDSSSMLSEAEEESSSVIALKVGRAREIQRERFKGGSYFTNSQMSNEQVRKYCSLGEKERTFLAQATDKYLFSTRAYYRILKISRTIADLKEKESLSLADISEAIQLRVRN